jgi:hypothetical protein
MDSLSQLQSMGLTLPSPAYLIGAILFSFVGLAVYWSGKRTSKVTVKWLGVALMFYPYAVTNTGLLYLVGAALTAAAVYYARQ